MGAKMSSGDYYSCSCHQKLSAPEVYGLPEAEAAKCDSLWSRWCLLHMDDLRLDVYNWLRKHSKVFDAWFYRCPVGLPATLKK